MISVPLALLDVGHLEVAHLGRVAPATVVDLVELGRRQVVPAPGGAQP